jgi:hypothetical protein
MHLGFHKQSGLRRIRRAIGSSFLQYIPDVLESMQNEGCTPRENCT